MPQSGLPRRIVTGKQFPVYNKLLSTTNLLKRCHHHAKRIEKLLYVLITSPLGGVVKKKFQFFYKGNNSGHYKTKRGLM